MNSDNLFETKEFSKKVRKQVVQLSHQAKAAHLASALSCIDLLAVLYNNIVNITPSNYQEEFADKFILSKGHASAAIYATLAFKNFFPVEQLVEYGQEEGSLCEHPGPFCVPGIEVATGSLGHGLPIGSGMALAAKIKQNTSRKIFVLMSDGECNEGSVWEAAMFCVAKKLNNLIALVDYNKWQATGRSNEILSLHSLKDKWTAFGWDTYEIDGHNLEEIYGALKKEPHPEKPRMIIANTIKGRGISFMEDDNNWHYRIPTKDEVKLAHLEIDLL
jgi:transketolase